jgi:aryl-alcohol dehydrogenase-like predicted oxidoreductase
MQSSFLPRRTIAKTGIDVGVIGLGTVKLGRNEAVKYPQRFSIPDDTAARELLALAQTLGINLIDTAPAYGSSEERLGQLLAKQRQQWIICTKAGEEFERGESSYHFRPEQIRASVERSLKRLRTDYLDIVLIHSDGNDLDIIDNLGALDVLNDLKQRGLIRATGMSTKTIDGGIRAAQLADIVMATLNPGYRDELPVFDFCAQNDKAAFVKKAFGSGHLFSGANALQETMDLVLNTKGVASVIAGTINPAHLRENVEAAVKAVR